MHVGLAIVSRLNSVCEGFMHLLLHVLVLASSTNNILTTYLLLTKFLWMHHCTCAILVSYPLLALSSVATDHGHAGGLLRMFLIDCVKFICHV